MDIKAESLGYAVPRKAFVACVHSIFHTSVNLQAEGIYGLLTLISRSKVDLPQGIRLEPLDEVYFDNLEPGQKVFCQDGFLSFQKARLRIDLNKAYCWECNLPALNISMTNPVTALTWRRVWEVLNQKQRELKTEIAAEELIYPNGEGRTAVERKAAHAVRMLTKATRDYDLAAISAAGELVGLGAGLTPSGDDLLAGYLTGLWCTVGYEDERRRYTSTLGRAIIDLSSGTNDISRTYLFHAAKGQAASYLVTLAQMIGQGEGSTQLIDAFDIAMQVGHSSGMDAVTGLLLGLSVWMLPYNPEQIMSSAQ